MNSKKRAGKENKTQTQKTFKLAGFCFIAYLYPGDLEVAFSVNHEISVIRTATLEMKTPIEGILVRKELLLKSPAPVYCFPLYRTESVLEKAMRLLHTYSQACVKW